MFSSKIRNWGLQMFAEGGEGAANGAADAQSTPEIAGSSGQAEASEPAKMSGRTEAVEETARPKFRELLQDEEYRQEFNRSVERAVKKRLRAQQKMMAPVLEGLGQQYGMDVSDLDKLDVEALVKAYSEDSTRLEAEASEQGYTVDDWKTVKEARRVLREQEANKREDAARQAWRAVTEESEALKTEYPGFDLEREMQNEQFRRLLVSYQDIHFHNPVRATYEAIHRDEIMQGALRNAVQQTKQKVANSIQAGTQRPAENGASAATEARRDPARMSKAEREDLIRRCKNGERIVL